jgi:hypothetical protein
MIGIDGCEFWDDESSIRVELRGRDKINIKTSDNNKWSSYVKEIRRLTKINRRERWNYTSFKRYQSRTIILIKSVKWETWYTS